MELQTQSTKFEEESGTAAVQTVSPTLPHDAPTHDNRWQQRLSQLQQVVLMVMVFSLFISVSVYSVGLVVSLLLWPFSDSLKRKVALLKREPVAITALALFGLLALGVVHSVGDWSYRWVVLGKYLKLLLIPIAITTLTTETWRARAYEAFLLSAMLVLLLSYMELLGVLPKGLNKFEGQGYVVFRNHIAHSLLMALSVYLFAQRMFLDPARRWLWGLLAVMGTINVLFMVGGRSGQIVLLILAVLLGVQMQSHRKRGVAFGIVLSLVLLACAGAFSSVFQHRFQGAYSELRGYLFQDHPDVTRSSVGQRLDFYTNTIPLILEHPILGSGTGSFQEQYSRRVQSQGLGISTANPHNEYLLLLEQIGVPGAALFLLLLMQAWQGSKLLHEQYARATRGLVLMMAVGCLFNSLLLDATEGGVFCLLLGIMFSATRLEEDSGDLTSAGSDASRNT